MKLENTKLFPTVFTMREAGEYARISIRALYLHIANGTGPNTILAIDGSKRITLSSLNKWILQDASNEFDIEMRFNFLTPEEAAALTGWSISTLNHWRSNANKQNKKSYGPRFFRVGTQIVYLPNDLLQFKASKKPQV